MFWPMAPLHLRHVPDDFSAWRLDRVKHAMTWDTGIGASVAAGRWNHAGRTVVYASADPATATLEVAVHVSFAVLDATPYVLTNFAITDYRRIHVVYPEDIPNPNWLKAGPATPQQRDFGHTLLDAHAFVALPSAVSQPSWNIIFDPLSSHFARGNGWTLARQERFGLDTRLALS
jgi:RES domain-containing protein